MQFIVDHWKDILLFILAVDSALIPLFPQVGIFKTVKNVLTEIGQPKQ